MILQMTRRYLQMQHYMILREPGSVSPCSHNSVQPEPEP
jgi:hypothetical protein